MIGAKALIFFFVLEVASLKYSCYTRYYYKQVCHRFTFKDNCQKWSLANCKPTKVTRHDPKCPRFFCDVVVEEWTGSSVPEVQFVTSSSLVPTVRTTLTSERTTSSLPRPTSAPRSSPTSTLRSRSISRQILLPTPSLTASPSGPTFGLTPTLVPAPTLLPTPTTLPTSTTLLPSWSTLSSKTVSTLQVPDPIKPSSLILVSATTSEHLKLKDSFASVSTNTSKNLVLSQPSTTASNPTVPALKPSRVFEPSIPTTVTPSLTTVTLKQPLTLSTTTTTSIQDSTQPTQSLSQEEASGTRSEKVSTRPSIASFDRGTPTKVSSTLSSTQVNKISPSKIEVLPSPSSLFEATQIPATSDVQAVSEFLTKFLHSNRRPLIDMASDKDCGDRTCTLDYRYVQNCVTYVSDSAGECQFPCSFTNCISELHHFVVCPVWSCTVKTTTTPTTPSDMSTLSPFPTQPSVCSGEVCIPSIVFNVLFGVIILTAIGLFFFRRRRALAESQANSRGGLENPFFDDRLGPIIRHSERLPLLGARQDLTPRYSSSDRSESALPNFYEQPPSSVLPPPSLPPPRMQETAF